MVIIVTGAVGIGKSTVCRRLIGIVQGRGYSCGGVLTDKAHDESIIIEDIQTGERETLATTSDIYHGPCTPKYFFNPEGIDFGLRAIAKGLSSSMLLVDELGHLELRGEGFAPVLGQLKAGRVETCVLVIRSALLPAFLAQMNVVPVVFKTTAGNRNQLAQEIGSVLLDKLREG